MLESNQTTKLLKVNAFSTVVAMPLGIYCPYSNSTFNNWDRYGLLICPWIWVAGSITRLSFTQQQEQYVMTDWVIFYTCLFCPFYLLRNTLLPRIGYGGVAQVHHAEAPGLLAKVFAMLLELKRLSDIRHCLTMPRPWHHHRCCLRCWSTACRSTHQCVQIVEPPEQKCS